MKCNTEKDWCDRCSVEVICCVERLCDVCKMDTELEKAREFWAKVARENGWFKEPFFVQIWVNEEGEVTDSVSSRILTQDWVIEEKREECDECGESHYDGEDCGFEDSISWGELAELTHKEQVNRFGWCICEGTGEEGQLAEDCPRTATNGETVTLNDSGRWVDSLGRFGYSAHFGGSWVCYTCGVLCDCGDDD